MDASPRCLIVAQGMDAVNGGSEQAGATRADERAGTVTGAQLAVDIVQMPFERALGNEDRLGDFAVAHAGVQPLEQLYLALGQLAKQTFLPWRHGRRGCGPGTKETTDQGQRFGMLTPTMKIRRNVLEKQYEQNFEDWQGRGRKVLWV